MCIKYFKVSAKKKMSYFNPQPLINSSHLVSKIFECNVYIHVFYCLQGNKGVITIYHCSYFFLSVLYGQSVARLYFMKYRSPFDLPYFNEYAASKEVLSQCIFRLVVQKLSRLVLIFTSVSYSPKQHTDGSV